MKRKKQTVDKMVSLCRKPTGLSLLLSELEKFRVLHSRCIRGFVEYGEDSKISCTKMRLLKKIELRSLLLHGAAYMAEISKPEMELPCCKRKRDQLQRILHCTWKRPQSQRTKGRFTVTFKGAAW